MANMALTIQVPLGQETTFHDFYNMHRRVHDSTADMPPDLAFIFALINSAFNFVIHYNECIIDNG